MFKKLVNLATDVFVQYVIQEIFFKKIGHMIIAAFKRCIIEWWCLNCVYRKKTLFDKSLKRQQGRPCPTRRNNKSTFKWALHT